MNSVYKLRILIVGLTTVLSFASFNNSNFKKGFAMIKSENNNN